MFDTHDLSGYETDLDETGETVVLCGASAYEEKYYLNPLFERMPEDIKDELQIICVLFVEENSGIFTMEFNEDNELLFRTRAADGDYNYDEIGAQLSVRQIEKNRKQLIESLELYYRVVVLGMPLEDA